MVKTTNQHIFDNFLIYFVLLVRCSLKILKTGCLTDHPGHPGHPWPGDFRNELFRDSRVNTYLETLDIDVQQSDAWANLKQQKFSATMMIWDIHISIDIQVHDAWRKVWRDPLVLQRCWSVASQLGRLVEPRIGPVGHQDFPWHGLVLWDSKRRYPYYLSRGLSTSPLLFDGHVRDVYHDVPPFQTDWCAVLGTPKSIPCDQVLAYIFVIIPMTLSLMVA